MRLHVYQFNLMEISNDYILAYITIPESLKVYRYERYFSYHNLHHNYCGSSSLNEEFDNF